MERINEKNWNVRLLWNLDIVGFQLAFQPTPTGSGGARAELSGDLGSTQPWPI